MRVWTLGFDLEDLSLGVGGTRPISRSRGSVSWDLMSCDLCIPYIAGVLLDGPVEVRGDILGESQH